MSRSAENRERKKMSIMIQGYEVILHFAEKANPPVAIQVKQALLGEAAADWQDHGVV